MHLVSAFTLCSPYVRIRCKYISVFEHIMTGFTLASVFSGSQCMAFYFKGDQLFARRAEVPVSEQEGWTSFLMDLREPMEMPDFDAFTRFLTTSMVD